MPQKLRPFVILSLSTLFYVYGFVLRIMPSAMTHELMQGFNIQAPTLGILVGLMYWGYTLMQIPSGLLFDRFNARYILTSAILVCTAGTFLLGATDNILIACIGSFIMGLGEAFGFVGILVLASRWFAPKYFAFICGLVQLMGSLGAILGGGPLALLVDHFGWRSSILLIAYCGLFLAFLLWIVVRENAAHPTKTVKNSLSELQRLKTVSKSKQNWLIAIYSFCIWAPVLILAGLWLVPFLMILKQTSNTIAAAAVAWVWLGIAVGSPLFGWWSDRIRRRCFPLTLSAFFSLIPALFIIYNDHLSWLVINILLFCFGIGAAGQALSFGVVQDNNPPHVAGTAVGFNNMAVVFGGVILQPLVGFLLHIGWNGVYENKVPFYTLSNYRLALIAAPVCSFVALVISWLFLKETYCRPTYESSSPKSASSFSSNTSVNRFELDDKVF